MPQQIFFHQADRKLTLQHKNQLKQFITILFTQENKALERLDYIFCSDEHLLTINQNHLQHDYYTDIITFDLSTDTKQPTIGEIYISIDRVKDNAKLHNTTFTQEILRVIFHGALHLCGYKDKSKTQAQQMRLKEEEYLRKYVSHNTVS
ncbi:MAG TPA: rRNA maturation RNase YbeY [Chitinophagaceae bacterium]|nr:rRNA maturation RNase YbeY [Chitinophagaceae bacterium]HAN37289.1 rRNA maturation RNase YbeY [Chitinophagaceae bacterium]